MALHDGMHQLLGRRLAANPRYTLCIRGHLQLLAVGSFDYARHSMFSTQEAAAHGIPKADRHHAGMEATSICSA